MFLSILQEGLSKNKITISSAQETTLVAYLELMQKWNRIHNLTAITDPKEMVYLHIIDSLIVSPYLKGKRFLDVGSGAGLPGIPLSIISPDQTWVLLDKSSKKVKFLTQAIAELHLSHVTAIHERVENYHPPVRFDGIISRAFSSIDEFIQSTQMQIAMNGTWYAMKGKLPEDELIALPSGFSVKESIALSLKGMAVHRHLICIETLRTNRG